MYGFNEFAENVKSVEGIEYWSIWVFAEDQSKSAYMHADTLEETKGGIRGLVKGIDSEITRVTVEGFGNEFSIRWSCNL